jgi:hypothetical protein
MVQFTWASEAAQTKNHLTMSCRRTLVPRTADGHVRFQIAPTNHSFTQTCNMRIHTIETLLEIIKSTLESGKDVVISGFGKFCVKIKLMIIPHGKLSPKTLQAFIEEFVTRDGT